MANKRFIDFRVDTVAGNGSYLIGHDSTGTEFRIPVSSLLAGLPTPEVPTLKVQWSANGDTWTDQWSESSRYIRIKVGSSAWSGAMRISVEEQMVCKIIHFTPRTEKHPIDLNYCLDYSEGVVVHCDTEIGRMVDNTQTASDYMTVEHPMIGIVDDYYRKRVEGYLFDGRFYEDSAHTTELVCDEESIYVDLTEGENNAPYRYVPGHYEEFSWDNGYTYQGYYNEMDGKFYEDSSFQTLLEEHEYCAYQDLTTEKYYAWIAECFISCQIEAWFMEHGRLQIANISMRGDGGIGTRVKFQYFDANNELTFNGIVMKNLNELMDFWSMNLSQNKYEEKANKVQSIGKGSADLYPSEAAVIAYVQQNT